MCVSGSGACAAGSGRRNNGSLSQVEGSGNVVKMGKTSRGSETFLCSLFA